jgi:hypothetical protein
MPITPFIELTFADIRRVIMLCKKIIQHRRKTNPSGWYSVNDCMNAEVPREQDELDALYRGLSSTALQELIALKLFGQRGFVEAHHWKTDFRAAGLQLKWPTILEGAWVGLEVEQGLRNMARVGLLPGMPVWNEEEHGASSSK